MKFIKVYFVVIYFFNALTTFSQGDPKLTEVWNPVPRIVAPGKTDAEPPVDAIVLFSGKDLSSWNHSNGKDISWKLNDGIMTVFGKGGNIHTKQGFGDCQLHIEWRTPAEVKGDGQDRGNSGIFFMGRYELQVLDSYNNPTYSNGQAGSIYKQHIPLVNSCRPPGEWQSYDVIFTAPRFNADSTLKSPARMTVFQNGVLIQNNVELWGTIAFIGIPKYKMHREKEPLILQDHGAQVSYRNIWLREL